MIGHVHGTIHGHPEQCETKHLKLSRGTPISHQDLL